MAEDNGTPDPHQLLTREKMQNAIQGDLGPDWTLVNYEIKDFTKKGDNYMTTVTGVSCSSILKDQREDTFYVVKLNPLRQMKAYEEMIAEMYVREGGFLTDVAIRLNSILRDIGYPEINFPECVFCDYTKGREILFSRDMRKKGFKMFDRRIGMEPNHCFFIVKELAKLHGSSILLKKKLQEKSILDIYPYMWDKWLDDDSDGQKSMDAMMANAVEMSLKLIKDVDGYKKQTQWLKDTKSEFINLYVNLIKRSPSHMRVVCHGDCWNNNFVFRYDDQGNPVEAALLDLQLCRYASIGLDLNYFFYTSLNGDVRNGYYDKFLSVYFNELQQIMKAAGEDLPFTEKELKKEVLDKALFGIISGIIILPLLICESEDVPDLAKVNDDNVDEFMKEFTNSIIKLSESSKVFKPRFLALFDDLVTKGILKN